ncbi:MAG: hypothetical protein ACTSUO_00075 [Candidatus Thorarchaeota archaeon]
MHKRFILLVVIILMVTSFVYIPQGDNQQYSEQLTTVELLLSSNNIPISRAEVEIYNKNTLEYISRTCSDSDGLVSLDLSPDNYIANAITQFDTVGVGHHGHIEFTVEADISKQVVLLPMRLKSDHSVSAKIGPSLVSEYPTELVEIALEGDEYGVPLLVSSDILSPETDEFQYSPEYEQVWFGSYFYGVIETTTTYDEWHPIALIDSENGLTHEFSMDFYESTSMTIEGQIKYAGVTGSHSFSTAFSYSHGDEDSIICSNGQSKSRLSEFKHVYQTGSLYMSIWNDFLGQWVPDYRGPFQREFIDEWYTMSCDVQNGWAVGISETRETYLGQWGSTHSAWVSMSSSSSMELGFAVARGDTFGGSAKIQTTIEHSIVANHRLIWVRPTSTAYLKMYSGNLFDINTYIYWTSGGGCPFVSAWNGDEYVLDNNILYQSEIYGTETDWVDRYKLESLLAPSEEGYKISISEFENEHTFIDQVQLLSITHNPSKNIAVSPDGEIIAYNKPRAPKSVATESGESVLGLVEKEDNRYFDGQPGDVLYCSFKTNRDSESARLVLNADADTKFSIYVDILTEAGWQQVGIIIPRILWAHEILRLDDFLDLRPEKRVVDLRLTWTSDHKLDFIGLDSGIAPSFEVTTLLPIDAWHNVQGDMFEQIQYSDDIYAELLPGDVIFITFELMDFRNRCVDFVLVVEGRYYSLE